MTWMVVGLETSGDSVRSLTADWCCRWLLPPRALVLWAEKRHHHCCCCPRGAAQPVCLSDMKQTCFRDDSTH